MDENEQTRAVLIVHSDTSTGVLNPVEDVAHLARRRGVLTLVDGISSVGGVPFRFDEWDLDAEPAPGTFVFQPPAGAERIRLAHVGEE